MNAKNVLKTASLLLNLSDDFSPILNSTQVEVSSDVQSEFNLLVSCLNLTIQEVASDYIPVMKRETLPVVDNKIDFTDFTTAVHDIYRITLNNGRSIKYKIVDDAIMLDYTNVYATVDYSIMPADVGLNTENSLFCGKVNDKCLALGTASEYCYIKGFYEEAKMWNERFRDALLIATRKKSEVRLPKRRWL